jgi:two-component system sporulation sensor kinase A/two-component system, sporulation sensor kinase E
MNIRLFTFSRLRILFGTLLLFVLVTPWLVEWLVPSPDFQWKRPLWESFLLLIIVGAVLALARRELLLRREAERRYKEFLDDAPLGNYTVDREGRFTYANKKLLEMSGYTLEEILGRSWQEVLFSEDIPVVENRIEHAYSGRETAPVPLEVRAYHRNGSILHLFLHYTLLERDGLPEGFLVVVQDVTQARKLEAQLVRSERLAVAGQLAMGLAHEINNPLAIIKTSLRLMKDRVIEGEEIDETVQDIQEEVDRIAGMVRVLLGFRDARPGEAQVTEVDDAVQSLLHLMGPHFKACRVEAGFSWLGEKVSAAIRPGQFRQIFFNLIRNALDAMPDGGRLHIGCRGENGTVCIQVQDTGCGIPYRVQERLYDPFFSTKSSNHHGLGLYVCYTILKSVGGDIDVESREGEGTVFTVCIPRVDP